MADVDIAFVARMLEASRRAHILYRQYAPKMMAVPGSQAIPDMGSPYDAQRAVLEAQSYRQQAHDADPDHSAPAWTTDIAPHDELMAFYTQVLSV